MKIRNARVVVSSPDRNFVTLIVETDSGLVGLGDATLNGRELAVAAYLTDHVCPLLEGRDATKIEDIWQFLYLGAYWRRGPVTMCAIAAVDQALWDLKGKSVGLPLYELLGGASREGVLAYGHANGTDTEDLLQAVEEYLTRGYKAVRVQVAVPDVESTYGVGRGKMRYEPATRHGLEEARWSNDNYLESIPKLFDSLRNEFGFSLKLLHDVHHRLSPNEAGWLGRQLEPYRPFWLEDPSPAEMQQRFRLIRRHTTTPLAVGEVFNSVFDVVDLITQQLIDYVRMSVTHSGGVSHLVKILHLAEPFGIKSGCHGATDLSPVSISAQLHIGLALHNVGIQEYMLHSDSTYQVFKPTYRFEDGYLHPGAEPGLGVEFDEDLANTFPYTPAYLPVARAMDGTVTSW